jgi:hypothetical protein
LVLAVDGKGGLEFFDADGGQLLGTIDGAGRPGRTLARLADHGIEVIDIQAGLSTWRVEPDRDPLVDLSRDLACKAPSGQGGDACPP